MLTLEHIEDRDAQDRHYRLFDPDNGYEDEFCIPIVKFEQDYGRPAEQEIRFHIDKYHEFVKASANGR